MLCQDGCIQKNIKISETIRPKGRSFYRKRLKFCPEECQFVYFWKSIRANRKIRNFFFSFLKNLKAKFKGYCYNNKDLDISHSSDSSAGYWVYMFQVLIPLWLNIYSMARLPCFSSIYCPGPGFTKFERDKIIFFNWKLFLLYIFTSKCLIFSIL